MAEQDPNVKIETIVTVLPDGRKVTKTIKKITHSYQVKVPAGTPVPPGARLVSTETVTVPANSETSTMYSSYQQQQQQQQQDEQDETPEQQNANNTGRSSLLDYQMFKEFNNALNFQHGGSVVKTQPTVVVQSHTDDDGRKVTKTTTTTSSSSNDFDFSSPFSKFFKHFKGSSSSDSDSSPELKPSSLDVKPLPAVPVVNTQSGVTTLKPQKQLKNETEALEPESKDIHVQTLEIKKADGTRVPLSNCTGNRRALLIGINYTGKTNRLHGCVNDTRVMKEFLVNVGFENEHIRLLTDDQVGTQWMPTRENIIENLKWLIHDAKKNDSYFLHYSGHGGQVVDLDGDETDGMDNCIFPLDHETNGVIIDDELHDMLVKALPPGVRLTVVFDCCHSGSALDLPYMYASTGYIRGSSALANLGHQLVEGNFDAEALKELQAKWQRLQLEEKEFARQVKLKAADADVIMFSGCKDDETSADVSIKRGGKSSSNGAMTYAFTKSIRENPVQSYQEMLINIRELLQDKYKQKPQLSSSRPMNMQELFHM